MVKKIPTKLETHSHVRVDDYYWLRERDNPEVIQYLNDENERAGREMDHARGFEESLFEEIKGRFKQTDMSVPYRLEDYFYYTRYEEGKEYPIRARKRGSLQAPEEIMLDGNDLARGHAFFSLGATTVSTGQDLLAYSVDTVGRRIYTGYVKNLATDQMLPDVIPNISENLVWANDNRTLFYAKQDEITLRQYQIWRHVLGTDPAKDQLVYQEDDETFGVYIVKTKSKRFLMIVAAQTLSHEYRYLDADQPTGNFTVFLPRQRQHEYHLDHFQDRFIIRTNSGAKNFRLMETPILQPGQEHWREILSHRDDVYLGDFEVFKDHLVVEERARGLTRLRVLPWAGGGARRVRSGQLRDRETTHHRGRRCRDSSVDSLPQRTQTRRTESAAAVWLWFLWFQHRRRIHVAAPELGRPRFYLCHRAYPRRPRAGPVVV